MNCSQGIDIPFTFAGKLPSFKINMDGKEEVFILDSGAPQMVLNRKHETQSGEMQLVKIAGAGGSAGDVYCKNIQCLAWGELTLENQTALVIDLSHLEAKLGVNIRGLIGYNAIKDFDVLYDYAGCKISLIKPQATQKDGTKSTYPLLFSPHPHIPIISVSIKDTTYYMGIDSGAEANLLDVRHLDALQNAGAFITHKEETLTDISKADAEVKTGELGPVAVCEDLHFNSMLFMFSDISHLQTQSDGKLDGIIGYELFSRTKTMLSYVRKEISFP